MVDIEHAIQIAANPETIYPLIATAKGFGEWWAADITGSADVAELGFFNRATVYRLKLEVDQPLARTEWLCETGKEWRLGVLGSLAGFIGRSASFSLHTIPPLAGNALGTTPRSEARDQPCAQRFSEATA